MNMNLKTVGLAALSTLVLAGCVVREEYGYRRHGYVVRETVVAPAPVVVAPAPPAEVVVTEAPPAPQVEVVTVSPGPGFIWVGGIWAWHGRWVWESGHWARPPHPGMRWEGGHYYYRGGRHVWIAGGWR